MRWRDIRFEQPTETDGDRYGRILQSLCDGTIVREPWDELTSVVAWTPLSELPKPDLPGPIPDGWRAVDKLVDAFDTRSMLWLGGKWQLTQAKLAWDRDYYYIVPVNPPAPQYRPFANAAEFMPHRERWWRCKNDTTTIRPPTNYSNEGHRGYDWDYAFQTKEFEDGTPFGVLINS